MFELFASPLFLILALALIALALVFVVLPMLGSDPRLKALRRRRRALEELRDDLDPGEYRQRLAGLDDEQQALGGAGGAPKGLLPLMLVLVPLLALVLYGQVGTPEGLKPDRGENAEMREMLGDLARRVNEDPLDLESWNRIGMIWKDMQQFNTAEAAFRRVLFHDPDNSVAIVELAETLLFGSGRPHLTGEGRAMLGALVERQPGNQKALWLLGFNAMQLGNPGAAVHYWTRLEAQMQDSELRDRIRAQIAQARAMPMDATHAPLMAGRGDSTTNDAVPNRDAANPAAPETPQQSPAPDAAPAADDEDAGVTLEVAVSIAPELQANITGNEVVFVFARATNGPPAPLAVKRLRAAELPATITLGDADAMAEGLTLSTFPQVQITARISRSGNVIAAPGDMEGRSGSLNPRDVSQVDLTIDQVVE